MGSIDIWKIFASLGVPGLALGVLYMLFRTFKIDLPKVPRVWGGPIVVMFMFLTSGLVFSALYMWKPSQQKNPVPEPTRVPNAPREVPLESEITASPNDAKTPALTPDDSQEDTRDVDEDPLVKHLLLGDWEGGCVVDGDRYALVLSMEDRHDGSPHVTLRIACNLQSYTLTGRLKGREATLTPEPGVQGFGHPPARMFVAGLTDSRIDIILSTRDEQGKEGLRFALLKEDL